ncbi:hypothetical protein [Microtetraspora sp. NBRC 16547]|uniref:hypothetical protein n=1 Tax=Microtetraspora sp. NBRC 16547 TaxID=3030993 RepID=UPI00249FCDDB|nr:hypothetical protein [Microtetraspora sp. NBRC 16547]GLX01545.1 hypothetical protein Misp02_56310 [Microtetraspora sp. NBRC 16547]
MAIELAYETHSITTDSEAGIAPGTQARLTQVRRLTKADSHRPTREGRRAFGVA